LDFSVAQRNAHARAYAQAVASIRIPGFSNLSQEAQEVELKVLENEAEKAQEGCEVHWWRSVHRLSKLLPDEGPVSKQAQFRAVTAQLRSESPEAFVDAVKTIKSDFRQFDVWMSWWLRPTIAQMAFPSQRRGDTDTVEQTPHTSNAVEHLHQLLGHASGSKHDLIKGTEELYACVLDVANAVAARKGECLLRPHAPISTHIYTLSEGHTHAKTPRRRPQFKEPKTFENDGRAPDTHQTLSPKKKGRRPAKKVDGAMDPNPSELKDKLGASKGPPAGTFPVTATLGEGGQGHPSQLAAAELPSKVAPPSQAPPPKENPARAPLQGNIKAANEKKLSAKAKAALISYKWKDNSCFIDTGIEAVYWSYRRWPEKFRLTFGYRPDPTSYLRSMIQHYDSRMRMRSLKQPSIKKLSLELAAFQQLTRRKIFDVWKNWSPELDGTGNMGDPAVWISAAFLVRAPFCFSCRLS
jgi:hypothetical protein